MTSISGTAAGPPCFSQDEDPPSPPHRSAEMSNWFSSGTQLFLDTNNVRAPIVVVTQAGNSRGADPAHANDHQGHPEGINTLATAVIPSGLTVPTMVILGLMPLHLGGGQYTPPPDQGSELSSFPPPHLSEPSQPSMGFPMVVGDITIDPRYLECAPSPGGFPVAPRNSVPRQEVCYDYQFSGHGDTTQEPIPDSTPAAVTASPGVAVYPPPFNQVLEADSGYLVSGHPFLSPLVNNGVALPTLPAYKNKGNGLSTSRRLLVQTYQDTPTLSTTVGPIQIVAVNQHSSRHQCTKCDAKYAWLSGLNRHYKDVHLPWIACAFCGFEFSSGRRYLLTKHLGMHHPNA